MKNFTPSDWYWFVAGDKTRAYSSAVGDYVPVADATFVAWQSDGTLPTVIDTEASLGEVLSAYLIRPSNAAVLDGYITTQINEIASSPSFKVIFALMKQIALLKGGPAPSVEDTVTATRGFL